MTRRMQRAWWVYGLAVIALAACLWAGWSGFDPYVPQETVRESIQLGIRGAAQIALQFVAPALLLMFLGREALVSLRAPRR